MKSFLDTTITVFENVKAQTGCDMQLRDFLDGKFQLELIEKIRVTDDKEQRRQLKSGLWCATISARCESGRKETDPFEHTGLICVDIDAKDNPDFSDAQSMKAEICKVAEVLYCALSVSGQGCFAILRLANTLEFEGHFRALVRLFRDRIGIDLDTKCGNIKRLRYASYDPEPYINEGAPAFRVIDKESAQSSDKGKSGESGAHPRVRAPTDSTTSSNDRMSDEEKVERYVEEIERSHLDITEGYDQWLVIGMALSNLGESGRSLFHRVSSMNPSYKPGETDKKFNDLLRTTRRVNLGSFSHICHEHGIRIH